jgi:hypothetical protein
MISTGDKGLDKVITGLQLGDNVVWQIDAIDYYNEIVDPFVKGALEEKRRIVYIRFAEHKPLLEKDVITYTLDASMGFESFSTELNRIIKAEGVGVFYVFDCLSDLLSAWSNDLMVGNFFKITCPFLFELDTIAYFSLLRNRHSFKTIARIRDTTQLLIDVYHHGGNYYIHPLKVWNRYTPTMFLPHIRKKNQFIPIANSVDTARLFSNVFKKGTKSIKRKLDFWDRLFMSAEDLAQQKNVSQEKAMLMVEQLSKLIISRDDKILKLAKENLSLDEFINIKARMIGTGFIGGKSVGMLLARNILLKDSSLEAEKFFEPHDSFYIGSDVFYTYIVENSLWKERMEQRTKEGYFDMARALKGKLLTGHFPEEIKDQFQQMIEYFGQSPIIVRSSSLLEDSYGNAFAGKYESIFLPNQGTPEERFVKFVDAVRRIYSSTMNEDALAYRLQRGLDEMDEQMALLVQRVSGAYHKHYFYPDLAGVGISFNTFVWKNSLDPRAGMLRLVFGLGTRAVNRVEGDYPRIVALDEPLLKAHAGIKDMQRFSQHDVDVLNVKENILETVSFRELQKNNIVEHLDLITIRDDEATSRLQAMGIDEESLIITFDNILSQEKFRKTMQDILKKLEKAYGYPVDIEFTINFKPDGEFQINLVQCRPMQTRELGPKVSIPKGISKENIVFKSHGNFLGGNIHFKIDKIIYVDPKAYCELESQSARYDVARLVGEINRQIGSLQKEAVMLLGPGRWGTSTPTLGVPVSFAEINNMTVLGEISFTGNNVMPELSFGTHFFQDLVETGIFYVALFPENKEVSINQSLFDARSKTVSRKFPHYKQYENVVRIFDMKEKGLKIVADIMTQKVMCYFSGNSAPPTPKK